MTWSGWAHQKFEFRKVKWPTYEEGETLEQITGGQLELSAFTDLKVDGSLTFEGLEVPDDRDLVRIYYGYSDASGEQPMKPLATLMFSVSKPNYEGIIVSDKMDCRSLLSILSSKSYGAPFTVPTGTQAIQKAIELTESLGLRVNNPDPSAYAIREQHTFKESEANYLTIVNWLLDVAGYSSAWINAYGVVQMTPYIEPTERLASLTLVDDKQSILYPELPKQSDCADTPNVVKLYFDTDEETFIASATNNDPSNRVSTVVRGYEVTYAETVSELAGETQEERLANLKAMARQKLIDKSSDIECVEGKCQYVEGLVPNNAMEIDYSLGDLTWHGALTNVSIDLIETIPATFKARRFLRNDLYIEIDGYVLQKRECKNEH